MTTPSVRRRNPRGRRRSTRPRTSADHLAGTSGAGPLSLSRRAVSARAARTAADVPPRAASERTPGSVARPAARADARSSSRATTASAMPGGTLLAVAPYPAMSSRSGHATGARPSEDRSRRTRARDARRAGVVSHPRYRNDATPGRRSPRSQASSTAPQAASSSWDAGSRSAPIIAMAPAGPNGSARRASCVMTEARPQKSSEPRRNVGTSTHHGLGSSGSTNPA